MARPRTELGTWGEMMTVAQVKRGRSRVSAAKVEKAQRYRVHRKFRDLAGKLRASDRCLITTTAEQQVGADDVTPVPNHEAPHLPSPELIRTEIIEHFGFEPSAVAHLTADRLLVLASKQAREGAISCGGRRGQSSSTAEFSIAAGSARTSP